MSALMPYSPLHAPDKHVSQEDMWKTLSKNAKTEAKPQPLQWEKPVRTGDLSGYMLEVHGRYSITRDADAAGVTYTAWRRATRTHAEVNLGCVMKREEAERLCQEDSQRA
jgi:hypothetical protein